MGLRPVQSLNAGTRVHFTFFFVVLKVVLKSNMRLIAIYRRFGTTNLFHLQGSGSSRGLTHFLALLDNLKIGCSETSVANYQYTERNIPDEWRSH
jgi:hypothetical protein